MEFEYNKVCGDKIWHNCSERGEVQTAMAKTAQVDKLKEERERIRQKHAVSLQEMFNLWLLLIVTF